MESLSRYIRLAVVASLCLAPTVEAREGQSPAALPAARAAPSADPSREEIAALRHEVETLREVVRQLQVRLDALATDAPRVTSPAPQTPAVPGTTTPPRAPNLMNPALSAVFELTGATSLESESEDNGFNLSEAEIALQAVVDPFTRADLFLAFPADESPEVEEGYVSTLNLPGPLQLKGGRFKSSFGKWNRLHSHAYFTVDLPNALENFLGEGGLRNDGLSLSVLIPNPGGLYLESMTEVGTALDGPSFNSSDRDLTFLEHLKLFLDTTPNSTLEVGLTGVWGRTGATESLLEQIDNTPMFSGPAPSDDLDSNLLAFDLTYKWRPVGYNIYRSFLWQTELLRSRRDVEFVVDPMTLGRDTVSSLGGYSYLEWQFARRFRVGGRYDRLEFSDADREREWAASTLLRFMPSEFQELRLQIKYTKRNPSAALRFGGESDDTQIFFEWIPSIGAHGAHEY
jgi:hypothetical protein